MIDLQLEHPAEDAVEIDAETLAAIDRGVKSTEQGQNDALDEVRKKIPAWISKFESLPTP